MAPLRIIWPTVRALIPTCRSKQRRLRRCKETLRRSNPRMAQRIAEIKHQRQTTRP